MAVRNTVSTEGRYHVPCAIVANLVEVPMTRWIWSLSILPALILSPASFAQTLAPPPADAPSAAPAEPMPPPATPAEEPVAPSVPATVAPMPAPEESVPPPAGLDVAGDAPTENVAAALPPRSNPNAARYGVNARLRWVTVPKFILNLFSKANVPLSSYSVALEGVRRKQFKDDPTAGWEMSMAIGYQDMSPGDGNWLGKNKNVAIDTDLVQFKGFGLITWDATFIGRKYFSPYFGMHYGAGLGLGIVTGKVLRTSAAGCTEANVSNMSACKPVVCIGATCTEKELNDSQGTPDLGPENPHRFRESSIPGAIPIIHLLFGLDFPIPDAKGLEFKLEGGFYDALFLGGAAGYVF